MCLFYFSYFMLHDRKPSMFDVQCIVLYVYCHTQNHTVYTIVSIHNKKGKYSSDKWLYFYNVQYKKISEDDFV